MMIMAKLKRTGEVIFFQNYRTREEAEQACAVLNLLADAWFFYID